MRLRSLNNRKLSEVRHHIRRLISFAVSYSILLNPLMADPNKVPACSGDIRNMEGSDRGSEVGIPPKKRLLLTAPKVPLLLTFPATAPQVPQPSIPNSSVSPPPVPSDDDASQPSMPSSGPKSPPFPKSREKGQVSNFDTKQLSKSNEAREIVAAFNQAGTHFFVLSRFQEIDPVSGAFSMVPYRAPDFGSHGRPSSPHQILLKKLPINQAIHILSPLGYEPIPFEDLEAKVWRDESGNFQIISKNDHIEIPLRELKSEAALSPSEESIYLQVPPHLPPWPPQLQIIIDEFKDKLRTGEFGKDFPMERLAKGLGKRILKDLKIQYSVSGTQDCGIYQMLNSKKFQCTGAGLLATTILRKEFSVPSQYTEGFQGQRSASEPQKSLVIQPAIGHALTMIFDQDSRGNRAWIPIDWTPTEKDEKEEKKDEKKEEPKDDFKPNQNPDDELQTDPDSDQDSDSDSDEASDSSEKQSDSEQKPSEDDSDSKIDDELKEKDKKEKEAKEKAEQEKKKEKESKEEKKKDPNSDHKKDQKKKDQKSQDEPSNEDSDEKKSSQDSKKNKAPEIPKAAPPKKLDDYLKEAWLKTLETYSKPREFNHRLNDFEAFLHRLYKIADASQKKLIQAVARQFSLFKKELSGRSQDFETFSDMGMKMANAASLGRSDFNYKSPLIFLKIVLLAISKERSLSSAEKLVLDSISEIIAKIDTVPPNSQEFSKQVAETILKKLKGPLSERQFSDRYGSLSQLNSRDLVHELRSGKLDRLLSIAKIKELLRLDFKFYQIPQKRSRWVPKASDESMNDDDPQIERALSLDEPDRFIRDGYPESWDLLRFMAGDLLQNSYPERRRTERPHDPIPYSYTLALTDRSISMKSEDNGVRERFRNFIMAALIDESYRQMKNGKAINTLAEIPFGGKADEPTEIGRSKAYNEFIRTQDQDSPYGDTAFFEPFKKAYEFIADQQKKGGKGKRANILLITDGQDPSFDPNLLRPYIRKLDPNIEIRILVVTLSSENETLRQMVEGSALTEPNRNGKSKYRHFSYEEMVDILDRSTQRNELLSEAPDFDRSGNSQIQLPNTYRLQEALSGLHDFYEAKKKNGTTTAKSSDPIILQAQNFIESLQEKLE